MKLCKDTSPGAQAVSVQCVKCNHMVRLNRAWADIEGRAFVDYYCDACVIYCDAPRFIDGAEVS